MSHIVGLLKLLAPLTTKVVLAGMVPPIVEPAYGHERQVSSIATAGREHSRGLISTNRGLLSDMRSYAMKSVKDSMKDIPCLPRHSESDANITAT